MQRHHWIYSGAVHSITEVSEGDLVEVFSSTKQKLGIALFNEGRSILAHMLAFGSETVEEALRSRIATAIALRKTWFDPTRTNAFRLINAEGDGIPGLIVDSYNGVLVMQVSNPGIEKLKKQIVQYLIDAYRPKALYEKSTSFLRKKEGMEEVKELLYGEPTPEIEILENGLRYSVDLINGQKTGLFLDQREMRSLIRELSKGRKVLNCFAYTGGFSVSALAGGATHVDSVETSHRCKERVEKNLLLNDLPLEKHNFIQEDVFEFLKKASWDYDLVILDPPAFVKKRAQIAKAFHAYKDLNQYALANMKPGSILLTASCSYHVDETLFQNILFRAADAAKREVKILGKHRIALDHPVSIFHPESSYLKSLLLYLS